MSSTAASEIAKLKAQRAQRELKGGSSASSLRSEKKNLSDVSLKEGTLSAGLRDTKLPSRGASSIREDSFSRESRDAAIGGRLSSSPTVAGLKKGGGYPQSSNETLRDYGKPSGERFAPSSLEPPSGTLSSARRKVERPLTTPGGIIRPHMCLLRPSAKIFLISFFL